jgi:DNA (cytosine-5)-methyltransferase 1
MVILDLFSGIGGFSKGLMQAGLPITHHYYSEIDKHAIANYSYNFKNSTYVGSVTDVLRWDIPRPNIITFGSPCQDFSLAGKRKGMDGDRSSLISYALMAVERFRPDVFIWENVKGAYSTNAGADYWAIMQAFANLDGYRCEGQLLNSSWFLPQNRERIYVVGHLDGRSKPGVFPFGAGCSEYQGGLTEISCQNGTDSQANRIYNIDGIAPTLTGAHKGGGYRVPQIDVRQINPSKESGGKQPYQQNRVYDANGLAPTIDRGAGRWGVSTKIERNAEVRRLTEVECERLQGFPDNWTMYGIYDGQVRKVPKTQRYKMCGNSVTVNVVEAIGKRLLISEQGAQECDASKAQ